MEKISSSERVVSYKEVNGLPKSSDSPQVPPSLGQGSVPQGGLERKMGIRDNETVIAKSDFGDVATVSNTAILKARMRASGTYNEWNNSKPKPGELQVARYQTVYM